MVLAEGSTLGEGHQRWMMNEINKLVWPSPNGVGIMDAALFEQSADIALTYEVITAEPDEGAWRNDLAEAALGWLAENYADDDPFGLDLGSRNRRDYPRRRINTLRIGNLNEAPMWGLVLFLPPTYPQVAQSRR